MVNQQPQIIAFVGRAGSGKSTAAKMLVEELGSHNTALTALASPIKKMLAVLYDQAGVSDASRRLYGDLKEEPISQLGGITSRRLMQTLGTEWGRAFRDTFWTDVFLSSAREHSHGLAYIVVDDVRFKTEARDLKAAGGVLIKISRPRPSERLGLFDLIASVFRPVRVHQSEAEIDDIAADYELINDGTVQDMAADIVSIASDIEVIKESRAK